MNLLRTGARMGLGVPSGIDLPGEVPGIFPVHQPDSFTLGETISLGIGQGRLSITPLQMANAYCAIANKGTIYVPHVLDRVEDREGKVIRRFEPRLLIDTGIPEHNFLPVFEGLVRVVSEEGGTAHSVGFPSEWKVAGKTGTAERGKGLKTHALFACITPYDAPELVVLVVVEGGGTGGEAAAPIARRILGKFYSNDPESP